MMFGTTRSAAGIALLWILLPSCGYEKKLSLPSPSGRYRLDVYQPHVMNEADLRINLVGGSDGEQTIYAAGHEFFLEFVHAYWSPDENVVAVLLCGSDVSRFAYDRKQKVLIPFNEVEAAVKQDLIRSYSLRQDAASLRLDPPFSPCLVDGIPEQFQRRHPHTVSDQ